MRQRFRWRNTYLPSDKSISCVNTSVYLHKFCFWYIVSRSLHPLSGFRSESCSWIINKACSQFKSRQPLICEQAVIYLPNSPCRNRFNSFFFRPKLLRLEARENLKKMCQMWGYPMTGDTSKVEETDGGTLSNSNTGQNKSKGFLCAGSPLSFISVFPILSRWNSVVRVLGFKENLAR
jgi:hypothetical protein